MILVFWVGVVWVMLSMALGVVWIAIHYRKPHVQTHDWRSEDTLAKERSAFEAYLETRRWEARVQREAAEKGNLRLLNGRDR